MKKQILVAVLLILLVLLSGCGNKEAETAANEAVDVFSSGDMNAINHLIFGIDEIEIDNEVKEFLEEEDDPQSGVLAEIFSHSTMKVAKVRSDSVEFEVTAPNMENLLNDLIAEDRAFEADEMLSYVMDYINSAEEKTFSASVPYEINEEGIALDYQNEDFMNAITGGFLNAYKQAYLKVLDEYKEGVS